MGKLFRENIFGTNKPEIKLNKFLMTCLRALSPANSSLHAQTTNN